jgi:acyl carrier protein
MCIRDSSKITPQARFIQDLQADSIKLVELMLRLEELGVAIPLEAAWDVETVGDAYQLYLQQQGGARTGAARSPGMP